MLEHEPQETPAPQTFTAQIPAAERRVSAEELTRAVSALEDAKAAERVAGVAPIGQVVEELGLDSTPEEIWAQVEKQRAQKAAEEQARQTPVMAPPAAIFQTLPRPRRLRWLMAVGGVLVIWSISHNTIVQTPSVVATPSQAVTRSGQNITISGDGQAETLPVQGKDVVVTGDGDNITLQGKARSVTVSGDGNALSGDAPKESSITGDGNNVQWNGAP